MSESHRLLGNRYEIGDLLGRGGMAEVYLGRDTRLSRIVAVKLLRLDLARDPVFQARFRREAQSAAALNHPSIVAVYDTGEEQYSDHTGLLVALPYIVMEYVDGQTLKELLSAGPLDMDTAIDATIPVLSALEYSHRAGIVHRDIKPANVMRTSTGEIKVMDFGIARAMADAAATMTATQSVIGTAQYLSPEQARGETVDTRSDLYSAGCLLFELVTGRPPFVAESPVAVAYQHVREVPPTPSSLNPAVPADLDRVILHALAKDRESRYQSAADFRADLKAVRSGHPLAASTGQNAATEVIAQDAVATQAVPYPAGYPQNGNPGGTTPLPVAAPAQRTSQLEQPYGENGYAGGREQRRGRGAGFVVLGLLAAAVFAAVGYLTWNLVSNQAPQQVVVPSVKGLTEDAARSKLQGFQVTTTEGSSETIDVGRVMDQNPAANTTVDAGSSVELVISSGSNQVQLPPVEDFSVAQATTALEGLGLVVAQATETTDSAISKGKVVGTVPGVGQYVAKGSTVTLRVSSGKVTVPDVVGQSYEAAAAALNKLQINVRQTTAESDQAEGTVISSDPPAGTKVDAGSATVTLTLAAPAAVVPSETPTPVAPSSTPAPASATPTSPTPSPTATP